jgi:hypothetical protein
MVDQIGKRQLLSALTELGCVSRRTGRQSASGSRVTVGNPTTSMATEAVLDRVASDWTRVGVFFRLVPTLHAVDLENLICRTAEVARDDERVFVCAASWLAAHHAFVNGRRLSALASNLSSEPLAVLGALLSLAAASSDGRAPEIEAALARCRPVRASRPLFRIMEQFPSLRARVKAQALPIFAAWGFWHDDRALKPDIIRPVEWLLDHVPELRCRALLGPSVEADLTTLVLASGGIGATAQEFARSNGVSYAAAHGAATRLIQRGVLSRARSGVRQLLRLTPFAARWFSAHSPTRVRRGAGSAA